MEKFLALLGQNVFGGITTAGNTILVMFEQVGSLFPNFKIDGLKNLFLGLFNGFKEKVAPDLTAARSGAEGAISLCFSMNETQLGDLTGELKKNATAFTDRFFEKGIPALNAKGKPTVAYDEVLKYRNGELKNLLLGEGANVGLLDVNLPTAQREAKAQEILAVVTGIEDPNATVASLVANPPTGGLVAMLANIMQTAHGPDFVKGTLDPAKIVMNMKDMPSNPIPQYVMPELPGVTQPTAVTTNSPPLNTSNTSNTQLWAQRL